MTVSGGIVGIVPPPGLVTGGVGRLTDAAGARISGASKTVAKSLSAASCKLCQRSS